ncbi:pyridoxal phosphate-dependent aminotransferase [Muriicola sp. Z0-33]|uniref:pyridoxal phosphate-dependent aminotransferase n=1 Tax=Muriicola sp. Z0-33 TaxID=2816957 RepID=UPI002238A302|nr:pyridoxal phosphate-dependent aminotransferase [Muriicola sp. Z0-33]MCW5517546.1 pyridoxal phosphate-dependent aminotransferase [Muriicola sp. Z0-33]
MFRQILESQTLLINTQSKKLASQNKKVIKFGFGQSPFLPPEPVMQALKDAVDRKEYSSVQGDAELRAHISKFHAAHNGLKASPDNILVAPGSKILLYAVLMAFEKADVFIPAPAWVSYEPQAELAGHNSIKVPTSFDEKWRINGELLLKAAQSKKHKASILILNYPGNPDGLTYTEEELKAIAAVARQLDILVISDEIYGLLDHSSSHASFATYYPEKTITTTGLSKWCGAGGWRLGVAMLYDNIEPEFKQALIGIASETYSCAPVPVQMAAKVAYGRFKASMDYVDRQIRIYKEVGNYCYNGLTAVDIALHPPEGGFYLFPDFSRHKERLHKAGIATSTELCSRLLLETGVALLPGTAFGFEQDQLVARLAYVDFNVPAADSIFNLERDAVNTVTGIQLIGSWLSGLG